MGNLSMGELIILAVIALLVFGAEGLPEAGKSVGRGIREFRKALNEARDAVGRPDDPAPPRPREAAKPKRLLE